MAKGQQNSNKMVKKPKKDTSPPKAVSPDCCFVDLLPWCCSPEMSVGRFQLTMQFAIMCLQARIFERHSKMSLICTFASPTPQADDGLNPATMQLRNYLTMAYSKHFSCPVCPITKFVLPN